MNRTTPFEALNACLAKAATQTALANEIGCSQSAIWKMLQVKRMSVDYVLKAERIYGVSRHDLRPDIYPRQYMIDQGSTERFVGIDLGRADRMTGIDRSKRNRAA